MKNCSLFVWFKIVKREKQPESSGTYRPMLGTVIWKAQNHAVVPPDLMTMGLVPVWDGPADREYDIKGLTMNMGKFTRDEARDWLDNNPVGQAFKEGAVALYLCEMPIIFPGVKPTNNDVLSC